MAVIKCPSCGKNVSDRVQTCLYCGEKIVQGMTNSVLPSDGKPTKFMGVSNEKKLLVIILVIFLGFPFLFGFMGGLSGRSRSNNRTSSSSTGSSSTYQAATEDDGKIAVPAVSTSLIGENYADVEKILSGAGFQNIVLEPHDDLVTGWMISDGDVEKVSIGGYTSFDTSSRYAADTEIVITYHTFPEETEEQSVANADDTDDADYLKEAGELLGTLYDEYSADLSELSDAADLINSINIDTSGTDATGTSSLSTSQRNAIQSAKNYLAFMAFSRKGLIEQLSSSFGDGYSLEDATFAVDYLEENDFVDWNEQAKKSAQQYLSLMSFSRDGLIEQLTSDYGEGFTKEQAEYAVQALGY